MDDDVRQTKMALLVMVEWGSATPAEAQALADERCIGPLLPGSNPDDPRMNPETVPKWNMAMAIAWIAKRDHKFVRHCWGRFERYRWEPNGLGHSPQRITIITASRLIHYARQLPQEQLDEQGDPYEAGIELFTKLANGELTAVARNLITNEVGAVKPDDWNLLLLTSPINAFVDWLRFEDGHPHLRDALFDWRELYRLWPPVTDHLDEPVAPPPPAGHVELAPPAPAKARRGRKLGSKDWDTTDFMEEYRLGLLANGRPGKHNLPPWHSREAAAKHVLNIYIAGLPSADTHPSISAAKAWGTEAIAAWKAEGSPRSENSDNSGNSDKA